jgi:hypothetical protein
VREHLSNNHLLTFVQVIEAIKLLAQRFVGKDVEAIFEDMGAAWSFLTADPQLRWIGPEKVLSFSYSYLPA